MADALTLATGRAARLVHSAGDPPELAGRSAAVGRVQELLRRAAGLDGGVLFVAERGIEVEPVARALHTRSRRSSAPFVAVACGAADPALLDRLLFGAPIAGAPPDLELASADSRLAAARGGTLFLEELGELPATVQARLARVARDGEVRIDGDPVPAAIRVIASAPPGIDADVRDHRVRQDLYRRLSASLVDLPPLRERAEDIPAIVARIVEELSEADGLPRPAFTRAALALLASLTWPGNLAELRAALARVAARAGAEAIQIEALLPALQLERTPAPFVPTGNLRDARLRFERDYIAAVLQHHGWRIADAAHTLGIQRPNLYRKARQLGIPLPRTSGQ